MGACSVDGGCFWSIRHQSVGKKLDVHTAILVTNRIRLPHSGSLPDFDLKKKLNFGFYNLSQRRVHCGSLSTALIPTDCSSIWRVYFWLREVRWWAARRRSRGEAKKKTKEQNKSPHLYCQLFTATSRCRWWFHRIMKIIYQSLTAAMIQTQLSSSEIFYDLKNISTLKMNKNNKFTHQADVEPTCRAHIINFLVSSSTLPLFK